MATLTISVSSALGTNQTVLTFSSTDAQRILSAYQNQVQPSGTQAQLTAWLGTQAQRMLNGIIAANEATSPTSPSMTATTT